MLSGVYEAQLRFGEVGAEGEEGAEGTDGGGLWDGEREGCGRESVTAARGFRCIKQEGIPTVAGNVPDEDLHNRLGVDRGSS